MYTCGLGSGASTLRKASFSTPLLVLRGNYHSYASHTYIMRAKYFYTNILIIENSNKATINVGAKI